MTCREKLAIEHPDCVDEKYDGGCKGCPNEYGYLQSGRCVEDMNCFVCWDRELPEERSDVLNQEINVTPSEEDNKYHHIVDWGKVRGVCCNGEDYEVEDVVTKIPKFEYRGKPIADVLGVKGDEDGVATVTIKPLNRPYIKDSGNRSEFETGAVRDIQEGKGRCDLMPLDVVAKHCGKTMVYISEYQETGDPNYLLDCLQHFFDKRYSNDMYTAYLEVAKHFEEGAKKYGENNWQKGIPTKCYINSAVRHYLKYKRGDKDEPHDRAFVWNILCCIWTCKHKPELNDYRRNEET